MYNFSTESMKAKIAVVLLLFLTISALVVILVRPKFIFTEKVGDLEVPEVTTPKTLTYKSDNYGISFNYLDDYQVTEAAATNIYGSDEAVVYTLVDTKRPFIQNSKITIYKFLGLSSVDEVVARLRNDFPEVESYPCKKAEEYGCVVLMNGGFNTNLPLHALGKANFGVAGWVADMPVDGYHIGMDYVTFSEPIQSVINSIEIK